MIKINKALISVWDKTGVKELAEFLIKQNVEILSTGGTAKHLLDAGIKIKEVSDYTGFPEVFNGRVKTLHPKIHAGILMRRDEQSDLDEASKNDINPIDLVVVNLYPFEETVSKAKKVTLEDANDSEIELQEDSDKIATEVTLDTAFEMIDIGGPTMVRAAAKNYKHVAVITSPDDYSKIQSEIEKEDGIKLKTRYELATKAFIHTAGYDNIIANYLSSITHEGMGIIEMPKSIGFNFVKQKDLRYGENPHQKAGLFIQQGADSAAVANAEIIQGKALSLNNMIDLNAALNVVREFDEPTAVIVKHTNPCGVASEKDIAKAYKTARECDPNSAFGGVIALNKRVNIFTAKELTSTFMEAVIAPAYDRGALQILTRKKNLRVLRVPFQAFEREEGYDYKFMEGCLLVQDTDIIDVDVNEIEVVSKRQPTEDELQALNYAWKVGRHVKSNAIVLSHINRTVGIGAGQMSRVDAAEIAIKKAGNRIEGAVMASDAFFPFRDSVDLAAEKGIKAIIEPGGSIRDKEVIAAANEHDITLLFTSVRHFKH